MLSQHLPALRGAPILALTATATPLVQKDSATQLGLTEAIHFIHGFRRENIGIEIVEVLPTDDPRPADGWLSLSDGPGFGYSLNEKVFKDKTLVTPIW